MSLGASLVGLECGAQGKGPTGYSRTCLVGRAQLLDSGHVRVRDLWT